jgi:hypothetical protein
MATNACLHYFEYPGCKTLLRPDSGNRSSIDSGVHPGSHNVNAADTF